MKLPPISFVGAGHMAEAILSALVDKGHDPADIICIDIRPERLKELSARYGVRASAEIGDAAEFAQIHVLAVKPNNIAEACASLGPRLDAAAGPLVVSIAAGVELARIGRHFADGVALIRAMPNLSIEVGLGLTALFAAESCPPARRGQAERLFESGSSVLWIDSEDEMHLVTAVSGSGPGFFFYVLEQMVEAVTRLGVPEPEARQMIIGTARGSAEMAAVSAQTLDELCARVKSPGGTTAAGLDRLGQSDLAQMFVEVFTEAAERSRQLAQEGKKGPDG